MPRIDRDAAERYERLAYPGALSGRTRGCWKTRLGDQAGLTQIGVGEVELAPGAATGLVHRHEVEDELVYVLSGEVVLVEIEDGVRREAPLRAGDAAGWKGASQVWHSIENRSDAPARLLEIGPRTSPGDRARYLGLDMVYQRFEREIWFEDLRGRRLGPEDVVPRTGETGSAVGDAQPLAGAPDQD